MNEPTVVVALPEIVQTRIFSVSPEVLFKAWSDPRSLSMWMQPGDEMRPATVKVDFRVGGEFSIIMHGNEQDYEHVGRYLEIEPSRKLVFSWISLWFPPAEQATRVTLTLEPAGEGQTKLILVHDQLPPSGSYDNHLHGWARILDNAIRGCAEINASAQVQR